MPTNKEFSGRLLTLIVFNQFTIPIWNFYHYWHRQPILMRWLCTIFQHDIILPEHDVIISHFGGGEGIIVGCCNPWRMKSVIEQPKLTWWSFQSVNSISVCHPNVLGLNSRSSFFPIQSIGLSLVQLLLHHRLLDSIPSLSIIYKPHPEWVVAAQCWEEILLHHNAKIVERYNKYTHNFPPLQAGDTIAIQSPLNQT